MKKRQVVVKRSDLSRRSNNNNRMHFGGSVRYGECLKNHAASTGGYALDGCREFMPTGEEGSNLQALYCAACGCHRNFHIKQEEPSCESSSPT